MIKEHVKIIEKSDFFSKMDENNFSNSMLFVCKDSYTLQLYATRIAQLIICGKADINEPLCLNIEKGIHPDVTILPNGRDALLVEDASTILDLVAYFPLTSDKKVFILNNFDKALPQTQNKLLKTLEEPRSNVYFILCAGDDSNILPTIKSRCQKNYIGSLPSDVMSTIIENEFTDKTTSEIACFLGGNYLGKTLAVKTNADLIVMFNLCLKIFKDCRTSADMLKFSTEIIKYKENYTQLISILCDMLSEVQYYKHTGQLKYDIFKDVIDEIAGQYSIVGLTEIAKNMGKINEMHIRSCNPSLIADEILLNILKNKNK